MRRFQKATSLRPTEYCQQLRIGKARGLLESTKKSVEKISWEVGYEDPASFRKVFQRVLGLSPREYRNRSPRSDVQALPTLPIIRLTQPSWNRLLLAHLKASVQEEVSEGIAKEHKHSFATHSGFPTSFAEQSPTPVSTTRSDRGSTELRADRMGAKYAGLRMYLRAIERQPLWRECF